MMLMMMIIIIIYLVSSLQFYMFLFCVAEYQIIWKEALCHKKAGGVPSYW